MTTTLRGAGPDTPAHNDGPRGRAPWVALAVVILVVAGVAQTRPGRDVLSRLGLSSEAERYTALSFTTPAAPGEPAGDRITASFAIANHEGADRDYQWTVSVGDFDVAHPVTNGSTRVADGDTVAVEPAVPDPCPTPGATTTRERITVSVSDPTESIGFWLSCPQAGATP